MLPHPNCRLECLLWEIQTRMLRCLPGLGKWVGTRLGRSILQKQVLPAAPTPRGSRRSTMAAAERGGHGAKAAHTPRTSRNTGPQDFQV